MPSLRIKGENQVTMANQGSITTFEKVLLMFPSSFLFWTKLGRDSINSEVYHSQVYMNFLLNGATHLTSEFECIL